MRKSGGFTLIELVMVIVILGILSAVALPTFINLQDQARDAACRGSIGGIRSGIAIWYANQASSAGSASYPSLGQLTANVMQGNFPVNPYASNRSMVIEGNGPTSATTNGWIYNVASGMIWATGIVPSGIN